MEWQPCYSPVMVLCFVMTFYLGLSYFAPTICFTGLETGCKHVLFMLFFAQSLIIMLALDWNQGPLEQSYWYLDCLTTAGSNFILCFFAIQKLNIVFNSLFF